MVFDFSFCYHSFLRTKEHNKAGFQSIGNTKNREQFADNDNTWIQGLQSGFHVEIESLFG